MPFRKVQRVIDGQATSDGAGVRLKRSIGTADLDHLDPFLLFDEFKSDQADDYIAGFPDHPHRGFETVTYMLAGRMEHRDHAGNRGNLVAGSVQWMTAGRGIVHSEMPQQEDGLMWGFQLWINLPASLKMTSPRYQDIPPEDVPEVPIDGGLVRVVAGETAGVAGPISGIATNPVYLDIRLDPDSFHVQALPEEHGAFVYAYRGRGAVVGPDGDAATPIREGQMAVLGPGTELRVDAADGELNYLVVAAKPIEEPIARYGPFVMNTQEEIEQAFRDYRGGTFLDD